MANEHIRTNILPNNLPKIYFKTKQKQQKTTARTDAKRTTEQQDKLIPNKQNHTNKQPHNKSINQPPNNNKQTYNISNSLKN